WTDTAVAAGLPRPIPDHGEQPPAETSRGAVWAAWTARAAGPCRHPAAPCRGKGRAIPTGRRGPAPTAGCSGCGPGWVMAGMIQPAAGPVTILPKLRRRAAAGKAATAPIGLPAAPEPTAATGATASPAWGAAIRA